MIVCYLICFDGCFVIKLNEKRAGLRVAAPALCVLCYCVVLMPIAVTLCSGPSSVIFNSYGSLLSALYFNSNAP